MNIGNSEFALTPILVPTYTVLVRHYQTDCGQENTTVTGVKSG